MDITSNDCNLAENQIIITQATAWHTTMLTK